MKRSVPLGAERRKHVEGKALSSDAHRGGFALRRPGGATVKIRPDSRFIFKKTRRFPSSPSRGSSGIPASTSARRGKRPAGRPRNKGFWKVSSSWARGLPTETIESLMPNLRRIRMRICARFHRVKGLDLKRVLHRHGVADPVDMFLIKPLGGRSPSSIAVHPGRPHGRRQVTRIRGRI